MAVRWQFVGTILVVTESGVNSNDEVERAFVVEALSDPRCGPATRVLWDSRTSGTPLSSEDVEWRLTYLRSLAEQGRMARFALLAHEGQRTTVELARSEIPKLVSPLEFSVFTNEVEALSWLEA
jgi:hypothetical protein